MLVDYDANSTKIAVNIGQVFKLKTVKHKNKPVVSHAIQRKIMAHPKQGELMVHPKTRKKSLMEKLAVVGLKSISYSIA